MFFFCSLQFCSTLEHIFQPWALLIVQGTGESLFDYVFLIFFLCGLPQSVKPC